MCDGERTAGGESLDASGQEVRVRGEAGVAGAASPLTEPEQKLLDNVLQLISINKHVLLMEKEKLQGLSNFLATDKSGNMELRGKVIAMALSLNQTLETIRHTIHQLQDIAKELSE